MDPDKKAPRMRRFFFLPGFLNREPGRKREERAGPARPPLRLTAAGAFDPGGDPAGNAAAGARLPEAGLSGKPELP